MLHTPLTTQTFNLISDICPILNRFILYIITEILMKNRQKECVNFVHRRLGSMAVMATHW